MNEILHFLTGYFIALTWLNSKKKQSNAFETHKWLLIITGMAGLIPDFSEGFLPFSPHGTWTHTILGTIGLTLGFTLIVYLLCKDTLKNHEISGKELITLTMIAALSHLILDIFTHQKFRCVEATADMIHIYFWPLWDQSFHMDCLFGWSYTIRIIIEWVIYMPIILLWIIIRWRKNHENPLQIFFPRKWTIPTEKLEYSPKFQKIRMVIAAYFLLVVWLIGQIIIHF